MDFVTRLPKSVKGHDAIWIIGDRLTKSSHFLPIKTTFSLDRLAQLYVMEIMRLCKVEFNQPSCWLYSVLNLLVI